MSSVYLLLHCETMQNMSDGTIGNVPLLYAVKQSQYIKNMQTGGRSQYQHCNRTTQLRDLSELMHTVSVENENIIQDPMTQFTSGPLVSSQSVTGGQVVVFERSSLRAEEAVPPGGRGRSQPGQG